MSKVKSLLYIACGNGLSPNLGGGFIRTLEIATRLAGKKINISLLTTSGGFQAAKAEGLNVDFHILPAGIGIKQKETCMGDRALSYVVSTLASLTRVSSLPKTDVIYSDSDYFCDIIPAVRYKKKNKSSKWVAMVHHKMGSSHSGLKSFLINRVSQFLQIKSWNAIAKYADAILVYDTDMGDSIRQYFLEKSPVKATSIFRVTNGIDVETIKNIPTKGKVFTAVMVGGLRPGKGLYDIIPIWKQVVMKRKDATLAIIGSSNYKQWLEEKIKIQGLEKNILLLGGKTHDEAISLMKSGQIYISPSQEEGWGIAICEALACNLPVIAYDLPAYENSFGNFIITVPIGDTQNFGNKILEILDQPKFDTSPGYENACKFDWRKVAEKELALFSNIL
jgi:glycosyltransferase involved in cell wall biosynthesis